MKTKRTNIEKVKHVYSKDNKVFMKENSCGEKEKWYPINFQWIPIVVLSNDMNKKSNKNSLTNK